MKTLVDISRILVASLFIVSGLIKANDPLGFSYKLEEYFDVFADDVMPSQDSIAFQLEFDDGETVEKVYFLRPGDEVYAFEGSLSDPSIKILLPDGTPYTEDTIPNDTIHLDTLTTHVFNAYINGALVAEREFDFEIPEDAYNIKLNLHLAGEQKYKDNISIKAKKGGLYNTNLDVSANVKEASFLAGFFKWCKEHAFMFAMLISVIEIVLGVAILIGALPIMVSWLLLIMIVQFTFLTFYSAYFNKVTDCGCFGDALKLTPWESFTKDIVLLFFVGIIWLGRKKIEFNSIKTDMIFMAASLVLIAAFSFGVISWGFPVLFSLVIFAAVLGVKKLSATKKGEWSSSVAVFGIALVYSIYCFWHLPVKDFRPYKAGNNIWDLMQMPPGAKEDVFEDYWYYEVNGETKEYTTAEAPWEIEGAKFVDRTTTLIEKGYEPPIHDFSISTEDGDDLTELILKNSKDNFIIVAYDLNLTDKEGWEKIKELQETLDPEGIEFKALTASFYGDIEKLRHELGLGFNFYTSDATALKTIIRSNPALLLLNSGTIKGKWHHNDIPSAEEIKSKYLSK